MELSEGNDSMFGGGIISEGQVSIFHSLTTVLVMFVVMSVVVDCLVRYRSAVRRFVHGSTCQKAVLIAILVNTLSMGIEHHEQVRFDTNISVKSAQYS